MTIRFASFRDPEGDWTYGAIVERGVIDFGRKGLFHTLLHPDRGGFYHHLHVAIGAGALEHYAELAPSLPVDYGIDDIAFLPTIVHPEKIICVGINYANRGAEYRDGSEVPEYPSLFVRFPGSLVGHGQPIVRPRVSRELDYEGEIAIVIGRAGRHVPRRRALEHIAGLTLANDGTVRDWVRHGKFNVTQGKNFEASGSLGPWMVPATALDLSLPLRLRTRVNGEVRQDDTTASMLFDFAWLIEYITTFTLLKPGDLILTGTPTGAGARLDPPRWLKPGDVVEVEVAEIGVLANPVVDEAEARKGNA
jgi:2-keto-4-pentenoate hydratase/2-oxohepta-3-ene-1,7-dioic acid hydratase in catechol pathway